MFQLGGDLREAGADVGEGRAALEQEDRQGEERAEGETPNRDGQKHNAVAKRSGHRYLRGEASFIWNAMGWVMIRASSCLFRLCCSDDLFEQRGLLRLIKQAVADNEHDAGDDGEESNDKRSGGQGTHGTSMRIDSGVDLIRIGGKVGIRFVHRFCSFQTVFNAALA